MSNKLYVGGLPWSMGKDRLTEVFASFGEITDAKVVTDRETGRSRGFGFVTFNNPADAEKALTLDGQTVDGRVIRVAIARQREEQGGRENGGGGGGGRRWRNGGGDGGYRRDNNR
jgi:RNA recognition motif-containing protein